MPNGSNKAPTNDKVSTQISSEYLPFIRLAEQDVPPEAPRLALEMEARCDMSSGGSELCITLPYSLEIMVKRLPDAKSETKPIIWNWSLYDSLARGHFVLLHERSPGQLEPVDVGMMQGLVDEFYHGEKDAVPIEGPHVSELSAGPPGNQRSYCHTLTANYQTRLVPGERYHLLWPGGVTGSWDWGTKKDHAGQELRSAKALPALTLLPAASIVFKAVETDLPYPDRAAMIKHEGPHFDFDWANLAESLWRREKNRRVSESPEPLTPEQRLSGAPALELEIVRAGLRAGFNGETAETTTKVTYHGRHRSVTFHKIPFFRPGTRLYRWQDGKWVKVNPYSKRPGRRDVEVKVGTHDGFVSLGPGESWTYETSYFLPHDLKPGDRLKFVFKGATLDWWDWGDKQDHSETIVSLPRRGGGSVSKPRDNDGRPKLIVPGSNDAEFIWDPEIAL